MADNIYLKYGESLSDAEFEAGAILFAKKDKAIAFDDPSSEQRHVIARDGDVIGPDSSQDGAIPIFNGTTGKIIQNSNYFPSDFATSGHKHTITPEGTVQSTFSGKQGIATGALTPTGDITITFDEEGNINYTPTGSVSITYTPKGVISSVVSDLTEKTTKTIYEITDVGTLPELKTNYNSDNSSLELNWNPGTLPQMTTTQIHNGYDIVKSNPIFTGTNETISGTFTGNGVSVSATFSGDESIIECTYIPEGEISSYFTGTSNDTSTPV